MNKLKIYICPYSFVGAAVIIASSKKEARELYKQHVFYSPITLEQIDEFEIEKGIITTISGD